MSPKQHLIRRTIGRFFQAHHIVALYNYIRRLLNVTVSDNWRKKASITVQRCFYKGSEMILGQIVQTEDIVRVCMNDDLKLWHTAEKSVIGTTQHTNSSKQLQLILILDAWKFAMLLY